MKNLIFKFIEKIIINNVSIKNHNINLYVHLLVLSILLL